MNRSRDQRPGRPCRLATGGAWRLAGFDVAERRPGQRQRPRPPRRRDAMHRPSPEVHRIAVTFRFRAPNAREVGVTLTGNRRLVMQKDGWGSGASRACRSRRMSTPIRSSSMARPSTTRPTARCRRRSAPSKACSSFRDRDVWLPAPNVTRGAIAKHVFQSTVANDDRDFFVHTPAATTRALSRPSRCSILLGRSWRGRRALDDWRWRCPSHSRQPDRQKGGRADGRRHHARLRHLDVAGGRTGGRTTCWATRRSCSTR